MPSSVLQWLETLIVTIKANQHDKKKLFILVPVYGVSVIEMMIELAMLLK